MSRAGLAAAPALRVRPEAVAPGVHRLEAGSGVMRSNVYFVRSGSSWVLIDAASAKCGKEIEEAAASLFGPDPRPSAILLTHDHPDHAGSARELAERWDCPVHMHADELRFATAEPSNYFSNFDEHSTASGLWKPPPLDRRLVLPLMHLMPKRRLEAMISAANLRDRARALGPETGVPGLPDWEWIHTPGHTPGHVAFCRRPDRVLVAGDAVVTVDVNSWWVILRLALGGRGGQRLSGPPWYTTWNRRVAAESIAALAELGPLVLAPGHGAAMSGPSTARELRGLADHLATSRATAANGRHG